MRNELLPRKHQSSTSISNQLKSESTGVKAAIRRTALSIDRRLYNAGPGIVTQACQLLHRLQQKVLLLSTRPKTCSSRDKKRPTVRRSTVLAVQYFLAVQYRCTNRVTYALRMKTRGHPHIRYSLALAYHGYRLRHLDQRPTVQACQESPRLLKS